MKDVEKETGVLLPSPLKERARVLSVPSCPPHPDLLPSGEKETGVLLPSPLRERAG
jgi:hypothetical protein